MNHSMAQLAENVEKGRLENVNQCLSTFSQELRDPDGFTANSQWVASRNFCKKQIPENCNVYRQGLKAR